MAAKPTTIRRCSSWGWYDWSSFDFVILRGLRGSTGNVALVR